MEALKEYAEVYGPLTVDTVSENSDCWNWINEPWPWQEGDADLCGIMKKTSISCEDNPDESETGEDHYKSVRWTGWRIGCIYALSFTAIYDAI